MTPSFLNRVLNRGSSGLEKKEPFHLPGSLHEGVRLLLVDSGQTTDLLFAMPLVEEVRDRFPEAVLGLVSDERTHHLALSCGCFQELIVYEPEQLAPRSKGFEHLAEAVRAEPWDVALLLGREPDPAREELALASGARLRVGPAHDRAYPRINCAVRSAPETVYPYRRTATWGRLFGLPLEHAPLHWPLPEEKVRQVAQLVHFNKPRKDELLLGVDPGVGKEGTRLGAENLAFLTNQLGQRLRSKTMLLTAEEEDESTEQLEALLAVPRLDLPRPTLLEVVLLLGQCDLFLSGNTDLFHFAVALGTPALGLFTHRDHERWRPDASERVEIVELRPGESVDLAAFMEKVDRLLD
jgi:heptosyltransferase-2